MENPRIISRLMKKMLIRKETVAKRMSRVNLELMLQPFFSMAFLPGEKC